MLGGVLPTVARGLHEQEIRSTTNSVLFDAGISWKDIGSIAVTVKPGMPLSLKVGVAYAKELAALHKIPLIPVHHMEAHALTATLTHPDGGHGLLALARGLEDFLLLGTALDASPGDVLEKPNAISLQLARRMKLSRLGDNRLRYACGGRAIELMAAENVTDPHLFDLPSPRSGDRDCDFSFTGIHLAAEHVIKLLETEQRGVPHFVVVFHYSIVLFLADLIALSSPSRSSSHIQHRVTYFRICSGGRLLCCVN
ncbi:N6-L-threonylcarbamoyladenine synthase [Paragonimus westermani]|uniref:N(6)-L-threonylcarbamoyladenine synthase n=1 Tax=Paragonimus westermani TaxID=34504 RepID=A0A5J4NSG6_9TREM|nr:N6-L-threonylcarbamoyladenine synthase [Paragonimus westermani]